MTTRSIVVFDTTLRDGEQTPGCALSPEDKVAIAEQLVRLGVDVIEAGFPAASPGEAAAVRAVASAVGDHGPVVCGLARANRRDIEIAAEALEPAKRRRLHTFIATSDLHLERKLRLTRPEVVERAAAAVRLAREFTDDVEFSAEDASRSDWQFLAEVLLAAAEAGAKTVNIPDTVGWATPSEYGALIERVCQLVAPYPGLVVSTHCHDDLGLAAANTLAGISAGAGQVEVTINGLGERAGNAALEEIVMALRTRAACFGGATTKVQTSELGTTSRLVSERTAIPVPVTKAIVGKNAFAHESGIHQAGMLADPRTYEIMSPEAVGAAGSTLVLGKHSGRHALCHRLEALGISLQGEALERVASAVKKVAEDRQSAVDDDLLRAIVREAESRQPSTARTMFEKVWQNHVVRDATPETPAVIYVDLHLVHEVTSAQAFTALRERGLKVRCPERTMATMDHATPTISAPKHGGASERRGRFLALCEDDARAQLDALTRNAAEAEIPLLDLGDKRRGIVHVVGPELGITQPGMVVVCGDSHTSTHGAFGALAFGIGTSQVAQVLATQCLLQQRPKVMKVALEGELHPGVTAKDLALALAAEIGVGGATGHVIEYTGSAVRSLSMEGRMTLCNMAIEVGARAGMGAPDETTIEYLRGRPGVPAGVAFEAAAARWRALASDPGARYDAEVTIDANHVAPMVTYGTNPGMAVPVTGRIPDPSTFSDEALRQATTRALGYMGLEPGASVEGIPVDVVFVGSCTNSRISDLRAVAEVLRGRHIAPNVRLLVVPGSESVKRVAEAEGLDRVFVDAGAEWREPGCSMCIAMNGDKLTAGQLAVSTSNRNFEGRQGTGGRTVLASPVTAAACAIAGSIADPRPYLAGVPA